MAITSCTTGEYAMSAPQYNMAVTYGIPYYYEGRILYYHYDGYYYYPHYYGSVVRYHRFHKPLTYHYYVPQHRPHGYVNPGYRRPSHNTPKPFNHNRNNGSANRGRNGGRH